MTAPNVPLEHLKPAVETGFPFAANTGVRIDAADHGYVRMTMPIEGNGNHIGTMYAGALFTLAELPGGALFLATFDASRFYPIVTGMDIRFLKMARTDISVEVRMEESEVERLTAEAGEAGKARYSWTCDLVDTDGVVVARSTNDYQMRAHGS